VLTNSTIFSRLELNQQPMRWCFIGLLMCVGMVGIVLCFSHPIGDFGNYYYGSLFFNGLTSEIYKRKAIDFK
jgi:hypothetical protein